MKYLDSVGLAYLWSKISSLFAKKEDVSQYIVCTLAEYLALESYNDNTYYIIESSDNTQDILRIMKGDSEVWPLTQYITDDLVYHFDGIDKGTDATRWTDLVSGAYFTLNSHSSVGENSVIMDGAGYLIGSAGMAVGYSLGTIEACVERTSGTSSGIVFFSSGTSGLSIIISGSGMCFAGASNCQFALPRVDKFIWSSTNQMCVYNGTKYTSISNNTWNNSASVATLGGRNNGTAYYFAGKIHSIRIYNRKLSDKEILINQRIDNSRFNMGLSI